MSLRIKLKKVKEVPVIELGGRAIDVDVKKFSKMLAALYKKRASRIVIDLSRTSFVDSHGLGIIVYYSTLMQKQGRQLVILNDNPDPRNYVRRLFEVTNLDRVMHIVTSINDL